jgi:hypothetical protein
MLVNHLGEIAILDLDLNPQSLPFYEADRPQFDWFLILGRVTPAERERVSVSMRLPQ